MLAAARHRTSRVRAVRAVADAAALRKLRHVRTKQHSANCPNDFTRWHRRTAKRQPLLSPENWLDTNSGDQSSEVISNRPRRRQWTAERRGRHDRDAASMDRIGRDRFSPEVVLGRVVRWRWSAAASSDSYNRRLLARGRGLTAKRLAGATRTARCLHLVPTHHRRPRALRHPSSAAALAPLDGRALLHRDSDVCQELTIASVAWAAFRPAIASATTGWCRATSGSL
jgi:hypothetical protein